MTSLSRSLLLAASLVAVPMVGALAQNNPTGNYGSNRSATAAPGTADSKMASGLSTADSNARAPAVSPGATSPYTPGATGRTVVPGSNSTVAGNAPNTASQKTGGSVAGAGGGGSK